MRSNVLEMVACFVTAPGARANIELAAAQAAACTGQSLTVRKGTGYILNPWGNNNVTGGFRIRSGLTHGNLNNINCEVLAGATRPSMGDVPNQVYSQDVLQASIFGSAVGGQIEHLIIPIWYPQVEGLNANLLTAAEVNAFRAKDLEAGKERVSMYVSIPAAAVTGQWSGGIALSTLTGYGFKANRYYAVTGISTTARCAAISFRSTENAGVRCAVPGEPNDTRMTSRFFMELSKEYGRPTVPIFSAATLADAVIDVACNQAGGAFDITLHAILLNPSFVPSTSLI